MRKLSAKAFDWQAEREYYARPPAQLRDCRYLDPYYRALLGDYCSYFHEKRVLDIGAGECLHGYLVSARCCPKSYVNFDLFTDRIHLASQHNSSAQISFVVGNCFSLPFLDASFDVVWGSGILFRLRPLGAVVSEIGRVLHSTGFYLGIEPNFLNPLVTLRYVTMRRPNRNDGRLSHRMTRDTFAAAGFRLDFRFFWTRLPWLRHPVFSPTLGLVAHKASRR